MLSIEDASRGILSNRARLPRWISSRVNKMISFYYLLSGPFCGPSPLCQKTYCGKLATSHARLGLYVFCHRSLFEQCYELQPTFQLLLRRPNKLALNLEECTPFTERPLGETGNIHYITGIEDIGHLVNFRLDHLRQMQYMQYYVPHANADATPPENGNAGSFLHKAKEGMEKENGEASDVANNNKMEEDTVEVKSDMMQEASKIGEGNGETNDVAIEDKMEEENAEAKDKDGGRKCGVKGQDGGRKMWSQRTWSKSELT